jgi:N-acyl-D-aspartate/D-glutamate deacylase
VVSGARSRRSATGTRHAATAASLTGPYAGAHASQLCDACYSTDLLGRWVRELKALSLEEAVWRLTCYPANCEVRDPFSPRDARHR